MDWLNDPNAWVGLLTLTALEIVLGIDNIIFISILAGKLPELQQPTARRLGLMGAFVTRLLLLFSLAWIVRLTRPLFEVLGHGVSGRDLILIVGGLFLIGKATYEIHGKLEGEEHDPAGGPARAARSLASVVVQIMLVDIVFSLDSVITAVGMVDEISIMVAANVIALGVMLAAVSPISAFVDRHPTVKMLALSFLVLIGTNLVAEGFGAHIPKGYTYFAMGFSVLVEMLNLRLRRNATRAVTLRQPLDYEDLVDDVAGGPSDRPRVEAAAGGPPPTSRSGRRG
jgi:predicted tellurium resistance membrane protein TerC